MLKINTKQNPIEVYKKKLFKALPNFLKIKLIEKTKTNTMKTEQNKDILYIDYLSKENNFRETRMYFETYEQAEQWVKNNLGNFNPDMIKYV